MTGQPPTPVRAVPLPEHELAGRVLRWVAVAGLVVGTAQVLTWSLTVAGWGFGWPTSRGSSAMAVLHRVVVALSIVAPLLLATGAAGLLKERRWSRPTLIVYAFLQIAASFFLLAYGLLWRQDALPEWTAAQHLMSVVSGISNLLMHCLLPAAIIVCLVRPGLVRYAAPADAAFQVLPAEAEAAPPAQAAAVDQ